MFCNLKLRHGFHSASEICCDDGKGLIERHADKLDFLVNIALERLHENVR